MTLDKNMQNYMPENKIITKKEFKYSKSYANTLLGCSIFFIVFAIASRFLLKGQPGVAIGYFCFDIFALTTFIVYVYFKIIGIVY